MKNLYLMAVLLCTAFSLSAQLENRYIMAGSFSSVTTVDDSTYTVGMSFQADQTGSGFLANQIQAGYRIVTSTRKMYRVSVVNSAAISSANLTIVELPGTTTSPNGVAAVYQYDGSNDYIPLLPVNSTGISAAMQAIILIHDFEVAATAGVGGDPVTSLAADSITVADPNDVFTATNAESALYELYQLIQANSGGIQGYYRDSPAAIGAASVTVTKLAEASAPDVTFTGSAATGYTVTIPSGQYPARIDFTGNSGTSNASGELVLNVVSSVDFFDWYSVEIYDLNTNQKVDEFLVGNVTDQTGSGNTTTFVIPNVSGNYPSGFRLQLR